MIKFLILAPIILLAPLQAEDNPFTNKPLTKQDLSEYNADKKVS